MSTTEVILYLIFLAIVFGISFLIGYLGGRR